MWMHVLYTAEMVRFPILPLYMIQEIQYMTQLL